MTPLTESGWLFLGWTVFVTTIAVMGIRSTDVDPEVKGRDCFMAIMSIACLCWLVSP